jgi:DNA-binding transcriptional ArsR family regulator
MPTRHRSIKKVRRDRLRGFIDSRLIEAMGHPVREHILAVLNERVASPTEIGDEIGLDVSAFYKHVQTLDRLGFIECVGSRRSRGFIERFYRAKATLYFDDEAWRRLPSTIRTDVCTDLLHSIAEEAGGALAAGKLGKGSPEHVSWMPGLFDERGQREAMEILGDALSRLMEVRRDSSARLSETGEEGIQMTFALIGFEADRSSPPPREQGDPTKRPPAPARGRRRSRASVR